MQIQFGSVRMGDPQPVGVEGQAINQRKLFLSAIGFIIPF